ncbi:MAG: hypothetical protein LBM98_02020 [Oscillospiraceae bacterium]|jgi:uncharacterized membrane protein HdeD (DUF308 family)|nr:hypothetical protein [Oscillospiraceae bacterium]
MNRNCKGGRPRKPFKKIGIIIIAIGLFIIAALILPPVVWVFMLGAALVFGGIVLIK